MYIIRTELKLALKLNSLYSKIILILISYAKSRTVIVDSWQTHIERAISLNPKDPTGHYLLGRWCFGVSLPSLMKH